MTAILLPTPRATQIMFNRDELDTRVAALPPKRLAVGGRECMMPIDPESGGSWIGANDAGMVAATLNVTRPGGPRLGAISRGTLVPDMLRHAKLPDALQAAAALPLGSFAAFRLILIQSHEHAEFEWDGHAVRVSQPMRFDTPLFATSSGLGDHVVAQPRRALFDKTLAVDLSETAQAHFHAHQWKDRPQVSVCMRRDGAATVSLTCVRMDNNAARMTYHSGPPDAAATDFNLELPVKAW